LQLKRYLTPVVRALAAEQGLELVPIDTVQRAPSLDAQGPFAAVVHKLPLDHAFFASLQQYVVAHPEIKVIDPPHLIAPLHDRAEMLRCLAERIRFSRHAAPSAVEPLSSAPPARDAMTPHSGGQSDARASTDDALANVWSGVRRTDSRRGRTSGVAVPDQPMLGQSLPGDSSSSLCSSSLSGLRSATSPTSAGGASDSSSDATPHAALNWAALSRYGAAVIAAPCSVVLRRGTSLREMRAAVAEGGLVFPCISKPLDSGGGIASHSLALLLRLDALQVRHDPHQHHHHHQQRGLYRP
jgi:Inositol 1,3,4-trisphosphate 5/6-kinase pre-ATP-grasp domain